MAEQAIPDALTINGTIYRPQGSAEAAQEQLLRDIKTALTERPSGGKAAPESTPLVATALRQLTERLDRIEQGLTVTRTTGIAPSTVELFKTRLDRIEERLNQPASVALPVSLVQQVGRIEAATRDASSLREALSKFADADLDRHMLTLDAVRQGIDRIKSLAADVQMLVELADQATAPLAGVPATADFLDRTAERAQATEWLQRYLSTPTLTYQQIGPALGCTPEAARHRLTKAARATGQTAALQARGKLGRGSAGRRNLSQWAVGGAPAPGNTTAGMSS